MQNDQETIEFSTPSAFRNWLESNVGKQEGTWLRIYKKSSGVKTVTYAEALDEALCFGWIDGIRKSYDEQSYIQKFTPRRKRSLWSKRNIEHIERLRSEGKMSQTGEAEVQRAIEDGRWAAAYDAPSTMVVPDYFLKRLDESPRAKAAFDGLSKSVRYAVVWQLQAAKTEATRQRRAEKIIAALIS